MRTTVPCVKTAANAGLVEFPDVVLAENNEGLASCIEELLVGICPVHRAQDGEEATRLIQNVEPELAVLDMMMPKKDGIELCRELKVSPSTADIPVVQVQRWVYRSFSIRMSDHPVLF